MRAASALLLAGLLCGCGGSDDRTVAAFAAAPDEAQRVVTACDAGSTRGAVCDRARAGLIEARRERRLETYRRNF